MNDETNKFILIVDDNSTNLSILSQVLKQVGLKVRMAMDGASALNIAQQSPELILLDVEMPVMNGFEACMRLKSSPLTQDIPVIFMTAIADADSKVKGLSLGAVDYMTKPFEEQEVIARVNIHLQLRQLTKSLEEKTQQLNEKNLYLEETLHELKTTQSQLIHAEKMSGLGQMVAGVAHEINNPVSFIYGNINHAQNYFQDLLNLINIYQQEYPNSTDKIKQACENINLDFLATDLQKMLNSMQDGAQRIRDVVLNLRTFSRLDEAEMKSVDIHQGLESTLLILQHRFQAQKGRAEIQIIKEYGNIPLVTCYAAQLNQAFMNILNNAIDAVEAVDNHNYLFTPCIRINTERTCSDFIKITIADNGIGITQQVQTKIFDPFFTTKPVGSGSGLGLSISYQIIVEKHQGKLSCVSVPSEGSEFTIEIPISLKVEK